jgi:hypothetical protein
MQFKLLCPTSSIGAVIGKQGATIKEVPIVTEARLYRAPVRYDLRIWGHAQVRESTNAKIHIDDPVPRCDERVITIAPGAARTHAAPEYAGKISLASALHYHTPVFNSWSLQHTMSS